MSTKHTPGIWNANGEDLRVIAAELLAVLRETLEKLEYYQRDSGIDPYTVPDNARASATIAKATGVQS